MARTRRFSDMAQEALRLRNLGMSQREIAAHLGVAKSTVTRWIQKGKLPKLVVDNTLQPADPISGEITPDDWAQAMRAEFKLSPSDDMLVTLGHIAATITRDVHAKRSERLNAIRTFASIDGRLQLVIKAARAAEVMAQQPLAQAVNAAPAVPRKPRAVKRSTSDPRLAVIK